MARDLAAHYGLIMERQAGVLCGLSLSLSLSLCTVLLRTVCLEENAQVLTKRQAAAAYLSCSPPHLNSLNLNLWQRKSRTDSTTENTICTSRFEIENK